jgi:transposase
LIATWAFHPLATFLASKAARVGSAVEWVDPADTSHTCPAGFHRQTVADRRALGADGGWAGHRETVGAINISRRAGAAGARQGATGAEGADGGRAA